MNSTELFIDKNFAKVDHENKVVLLTYQLIQSGISISTYEKFGEKFFFAKFGKIF